MKHFFLTVVGVVVSFLPAARGEVIRLEHADVLLFDKAQHADYQVLQGNVRFAHEGALLYCDSAHYYTKQNSFNAYGHVRMVQGDTLRAWGDVLYYNGDTQVASLRQNVRLENRDMTLTTHYLDYVRPQNMGYYTGGGTLTDPDNTLTSERGYYYANARRAEFRHNVTLDNEKFTLHSDTLIYESPATLARIVGPSVIDYKQDDGQIRTTSGTYRTRTQHAWLYNRSEVIGKDGRRMVADTLFYDRETGECRSYRNAVITDSVQHLRLTGHRGRANEKDRWAWMTDSALVADWSQKDTLYLHADTLRYGQDSLGKAVVTAYRGVRFYREDLQGVCDSMAYTERDSTVRMYHVPIVWQGENQITGDIIEALIEGEKHATLWARGNVMVGQRQDSLYNQLQGRLMRGRVADNHLTEIEMEGNARSIYFPMDKDSTLIGKNETESAKIKIYFKNDKLDRIVLSPEPVGKLSPMEGLLPEDLVFPKFKWREDVRPTGCADVFRKTESAPAEQQLRDQDTRRRRRRTL